MLRYRFHCYHKCNAETPHTVKINHDEIVTKTYILCEGCNETDSFITPTKDMLSFIVGLKTSIEHKQKMSAQEALSRYNRTPIKMTEAHNDASLIQHLIEIVEHVALVKLTGVKDYGY